MRQQRNMSAILNDELSANWDDWSDFVPPKQVMSSSGTNKSIIESASRDGNNASMTSRPFLEGAFQGATNCTFNINIYTNSNPVEVAEPTKKRRKMVIHDSDSD